MNKKAQSEMVGFALIIIIVAVIILVFLSISLNKSDTTPTDDYELTSFMESALEYTTNCSQRTDYLPLRRVVFTCIEEGSCQNGVDPCEEMNETIEILLQNSWTSTSEAKVKGYQFNITHEGKPFYEFHKGNLTGSSRATVQSFDSGVDFFFRTYS